MPVTGGYTSSSFELEINGQFAGPLSTVEGGVAVGEVLETASTSGSADKHIAGVNFSDITFSCGVPAAPLADWLVKFLKGQAPTHDGAVVFFGINQQTVRRLEWTKASIVAVTFPALDGSNKDSARLTITIRPEVIKSTTGLAVASNHKAAKAMMSSNFSVVIPGVDCTRVSSVEPLTISQELLPAVGRAAPKPGPLKVADLILTLSEIGSGDFVAWSDDFLIRGNNGSAQEKSATIRYLGPNMKDELFSVELKSVGIYRLDPMKRIANLEVMTRLRASMYCEEAELVMPTQAAPPAASQPEHSPNNLREFLGVRLGTDEVARRLRDTRDQPTVTSAADRERQLGIDVGIAWAERRASFAELQELGTVDDGWSAIALPPGHSLSEVLEATGVVPLQYDGRLELSRDSMVEGILAGILKVMSEVSEEITQNMK